VNIEKSPARTELTTGQVTGTDVLYSRKTLGQLAGVFADEAARSAMDPDTVVYEVLSRQTVPEGTPGGLFFGTSILHPGKVGDEYFMTKGHFHQRREAAEYYWGISGTGVLLLSDEAGRCTAQAVEPGSLHYIPGCTAHRLVNTGAEDLVVGACWGSDAGHDYGALAGEGFPVRVVERGGRAVCEERK
jgi:glucose-6-phosphate isomerase